MTTTAPSTALVMIQPGFTDAERLALAGFLARPAENGAMVRAMRRSGWSAWLPTLGHAR